MQALRPPQASTISYAPVTDRAFGILLDANGKLRRGEKISNNRRLSGEDRAWVSSPRPRSGHIPVPQYPPVDLRHRALKRGTFMALFNTRESSDIDSAVA